MSKIKNDKTTEVSTTTIKKTKKTPKETPSLFCKIDDNKIVDGNLFTWTEKLTGNQKRFVIFYVFQYYNHGKLNYTEAARKAGYKDTKALFQQAQNILEKDYIQREIRNIQAQVGDKFIKVDLKNEINRIIEQKKERALFNAIDLYDIELKQTEDGTTYVHGDVKPKSELTEQQKRMIMGVKFEGQRGIVNYITPDKIKEENDLINIYTKLFDKKEDDQNDFDVETTAEIIGEKLQVKTKILKQNKETTEMSELATLSATEREEED